VLSTPLLVLQELWLVAFQTKEIFFCLYFIIFFCNQYIMGILHFRITEQNQIIKLDRGIHGQNMTLKKVVVVKEPTATPDYKGGATVQISFLSGGLEISSNVNSDEISIPFNNTDAVTNINWDLNFDAEDINSNFTTSVFKYDKTGADVVFDSTGATAGALLYIDMYFDYASLFDYNQY